MKLSRSFYLQPTLQVCEQILGKYLVYHSSQGKMMGEINEVEAYLGSQDPASHAYRGQTERNKIMFGQGGFAYIYFTYGMYFCMNVVTEEAGKASAVLLRSVIPVEGVDVMIENRHKDPHNFVSEKQRKTLTNGPGKLCQAFGLTKEHYGIDLVNSDVLYLEDQGKKVSPIQVSPRIGIAQAKEKLWRFYY
jgi:DNA-3-methyladenine glycosylase